jgi:amidase
LEYAWYDLSKESHADYPCAAFPVTFAHPDKDPKHATYIPLNDTDKAIYDKCLSRCLTLLTGTDDPEKYEGGPVGLQIIGRRFEEEKVLDMVEVIASVIGKVE